MPFKSDAQRRFMYARHPEIAKRWSAEAKEQHLPLGTLKKRVLPFKKAPKGNSSQKFSDLANKLLAKKSNEGK
jgi:hypothetical protein